MIGILLGRVEVRRADQPAVHLHAVPGGYLHHLGAAGEDGRHLGLQLRVVLKHAHGLVVRQADQIRIARRIEARPAMKRPVAIRRKVVSVGAGRIRRSYPLVVAAAIQPRPVQIALGGVLRRCDVIEPAARLVDSGDREQVEGPGGNQPRVALARDGVGMPPAVVLAGEEQPLPFSSHSKVRLMSTQAASWSRYIARVSPVSASASRTVLVFCSRFRCCEDHLARIVRPVHAGDIDVARVAGRLHPAGVTARGAHHSDAHGGVGLAGLGVGILRDHRIQRVGVIDEGELGHAALVELEVSDLLAVGTPGEALSQAEFLFVDPVGGAVDDGRRSIGGKLAYRARAYFLDI